MQLKQLPANEQRFDLEVVWDDDFGRQNEPVTLNLIQYVGGVVVREERPPPSWSRDRNV